MEVAIIGAGIGGLTAALALKQVNIPFRIYEGAPSLEVVGAGIIIANNAMHALSQWGVDEQVARLGNRISIMNLTRPDLTTLSSNNLASFEYSTGFHNVAMHRADLHRVLVDAIGATHIILGKRLMNIEKSGSAYSMYFEDGTKVDSEYVVGADGLRSRVRNTLFSESEIRDAGQTCWRGVADYELPEAHHHELNEAWGKGTRFGFVRLNTRQVYWYMLLDNQLADIRLDIMPFLEHFHPLVSTLVRATPKDKWIVAPLFDLKPLQQWSRDGLCLVGDAAHATTPNLGQGACQAIEDAYVFGQLLQRYSIADAIDLYPSIRMKKAHYIVDKSWRLGKLAHLKNPIAISLRNFVMKATPQWVSRKQLEKVFTLDKV